MTTAIPGIEDDRNRRRRRRWWCGGGRALLIYAFLSEVIVVLQDKRVRSRSQEIRAKVEHKRVRHVPTMRVDKVQPNE
ncbi:hypothetical protein Csa_014114 [Cucumis sativus]|nr:hypothetical protein Csa_014114 [Cucumis sativus]